jgi:hypothetical protein
MSPPFASCATVAIAPSISVSSWTSAAVSSTARELAAVWAYRKYSPAYGAASGLNRSAAPPHSGRDLPEELYPFASQRRLGEHEPSNIATGPRQAGDEAEADRIRHKREHDRYRNGTGCLLQGRQRRCVTGKEHIRSQANKLGRKCAHALNIEGSPPIVDLHLAGIN